MLPRIIGWAMVIGAAIIAVMLAWPQTFGMQHEWIAAHVVALRGPAGLCGVIGAACALILAAIPAIRTPAIAMACMLALFAAGNITVIGMRGIGGTDAAHSATSVTVLSWNTLGEVPDSSLIADLALDEGAEVVVLPETTTSLGEEIAVAMRNGGSPMWVHTIAFDETAKARSTTVLISSELGDYRVLSAHNPGPPGNTNTLPSIVAEPASGNGPRIVAVHAVAPIQWELRNWRSDLAWLAEQCTHDNVIMAGDFNATVDHFAGHGIGGGDLGRCRDAAVAAGAGGLGTWPTNTPALLGSPIDHVLATSGWRPDTFRVIDDMDNDGSDHRPVVASFSPARE